MFVSVLLAVALVSAAQGAPPEPTVTIAVDSSRKEVVITAGPFDLPNMPPMEDPAMMDFGMAHDTPIQQFDWPMDSWFRGFHLAMVDSRGRPVPRHVLHHMIMVNFSRRMLLYEGPERVMGAGTETEDIVVPKSIGVPLKGVPGEEHRIAGRRHFNFTDGSEKPRGEWNEMEVVCRGNVVTVKVNGEVVNHAMNCNVTEGAIAVQSEGAPCEFREIVLTPLE